MQRIAFSINIHNSRTFLRFNFRCITNIWYWIRYTNRRNQ